MSLERVVLIQDACFFVRTAHIFNRVENRNISVREVLSIPGHERPIQDSEMSSVADVLLIIYPVPRHLQFCYRWSFSCH
jgi:hypothetical protein